MKMLFVELKGIKSIDKKVRIDFTNKIVDQSIFEQSTIKTIYGPNGAGKTGIVRAFSLYQNITLNMNILTIPAYSKLCIDLINKKTNEFEITVGFCDNYDNSVQRYLHSLIIANDNGNIKILAEKISLLNQRLEESVVIESKNGDIIKYNLEDNVLNSKVTNLLSKNSITSILIDYARSKNNEEYNKILNTYKPVTMCLAFANSLSICYASKYDSLTREFAKTFSFKDGREKVSGILSSFVDSRNFAFDDEGYYISDKELPSFKKHLVKLTNFLKLIKPDLISIEPDIKYNGVTNVINLNFIYKHCKISFEYESTGVKKLVNIFDTFSSIERGSIGIIDELDAGLHDKIVLEIIKYFKDETNSQVVLTTHDSGLMHELEDSKHSIDFISVDSILTKWISNGTRSPSKTFEDGRIPHIPFNVSSIDFIGKF